MAVFAVNSGECTAEEAIRRCAILCLLAYPSVVEMTVPELAISVD